MHPKTSVFATETVVFQGVNVTVSGVEVANRDIVCLLLIFLLLFYSCYSCYVQWKKNYQLIDGDFILYKGRISNVSP